MNWYYAKNGHQNGPLPTEDMIDRIAMGEIAQSDLAWCEGMGDWLPVAEIPQLKVEAPVKAESQTQASPVSAASPSPYQAPSAAPAPVSHQMMPHVRLVSNQDRLMHRSFGKLHPIMLQLK